MKKTLLFFSVLLALSVGVASAQVTTPGLYLGWDHCVGDGGVLNKTFACTATTDGNTMVLSWVPTQSVPLFSSAEVWVDISFRSGVLPAWWGNACAGRINSWLSCNVSRPGGAINCADSWTENAMSGIADYRQNLPWASQLDAAGALPMGDEKLVDAGREYFLLNIRFSNAKARVVDGCLGCLIPACIDFSRLQYYQPDPEPVVTVFGSQHATRHLISWQYPSDSQTNCLQAAEPVRNTTWGAVKSLYR